MPSNPLIAKRYARLQELYKKGRQEIKQLKIGLAAKLRVVRERGLEQIKELKAGAKAAKQEVPAELELLRSEVRSLKKRERLEGGVQALIVSTAKTALAEWDGKLLLPDVVRPTRAKEEVVAVAHLTDVQLGKVTRSYNTEIAEARMLEYARKVAKCCTVHNRERGIRELHVYLGGDMVEGDGTIFPKQQFSIDSSVLEQACINGPRIFSAVLAYWTSYFERIVVKCVRGNHGRSGKFGESGHPYTNWDTALYLCTKQMLEKALEVNGRRGRVEWDIAEAWYSVDEVLGHRNLLIHGDVGIKGSLGFPWYGLGKRMAGWLDAVPEPWDHLYLGHFHQYVSYDWNGHFVFCGGSPESDNEYARSEMSAVGRPKQRLQLWTEKNGPICDLPIYLNYGWTKRLPYSRKRRAPEKGAA